MINPIRLISLLAVLAVIGAASMAGSMSLFPNIPIQGSFGIALMLISTIATVLVYKRGQKARTDEKLREEISEEAIFNMQYIGKGLLFCAAIIVIPQAALWWCLPDGLNDPRRGGITLIVLFAYIFNELPTQGMSIIIRKSSLKYELPILCLSTIGYLYGFIEK